MARSDRETDANGKQTPRPGEKALVIVESPTKARTIKDFLPRNFVVEASVGHIRDLPKSASEIPAELKDQPWTRVGINIEEDFRPLYIIPADKKKQVAKLRKVLKDADIVYLATDEDREGESISWHLVEVLKPRVPQHRLVFHEITRSAIQKALEHPRELDHRLVHAQEARRILDRLYGYEVSPILWRKIGPRLSAGRVQSVAVRLVVQREKERAAFVRSSFWDLGATFRTGKGEQFEATLVALAGRRVATGRDFDSGTGQLKQGSEAQRITEELARELVQRLRGSRWSVSKVEQRPFTERPAAPFTTSTLQQEANRKLRLSARAAMQSAQRLYERGYITYMRTDSTTLSEQAITATRQMIEQLYGKAFLPAEPRTYRTTVKNAQEAHEAIRPSADLRRPEALGTDLEPVDVKLYEMIWKRTMACQMQDARGSRTTVQISDGEALFQTSGKTIEFPGFLRAYVEGADDPSAELADKETVLPAVREGEALQCTALEARDHTTQPPARYTEASLVKQLEALGIGRPSTYASILDTIQNRSYVTKQSNALVPTFTAFAVVQLLENHFQELVDVAFTARLEDDLDRISLGEKEAVPYLREFYFGQNGKSGLKDLISADIDARASHTLRLGTSRSGADVAVRIGRYGPYLERGEDRAPVPVDLAPDELTLEKAEELLDRGGQGPTVLGVDPDTGKPVYLKTGRFGPYVQLGDGDEGKPKMKSLLPGMVVETVTLEEALRLLGLPRLVGIDPDTGEEVLVDHGRYGPYVRRGTETRSLREAGDLFTVTLPEAQELLRQEKRGGRRAPQVLRELGPSPDGGEPIKLLAGRYGPYVTDGTVNASLPQGADAATFTAEQAIALLREKAARGPSRNKPRRAGKKAPAKKTGRKKATKKKGTAKATARKKAGTGRRKTQRKSQATLE